MILTGLYLYLKRGFRPLEGAISVLRAQGLPQEARPWRPHVTLARRAHGAATPHSFEPVEWTARSFELVCSDRGYRRVARWALAARAGGDAPSARCCGRGSR